MVKGKGISILMIFGLSLLVFSHEVKADINVTRDKEGIDMSTIIHPRIYEPYKFKSSLSVLFSSIPIDWIEVSLDAPIFQFNTRFGLPGGFNLNCNLETAVFSNEFRLGTDWNYEKGKFSLSIGVDGVLLFGYMGVLEFKNRTLGISTYPNLSIGYSTKKLAFTLRAEHRLINYLKVSSGETRTNFEDMFKPGESISLFIEQPLWEKKIMIIGLINNFQEFFYPAWPVFHVYRKWFYIPQIQLGLVL